MPEVCLVTATVPTMGVAPLYMQVLGLGLLWTTLHCSGMCGPLIAGLGFGRRGNSRSAPSAPSAPLRPPTWGSAALDLGLYQIGRALMYAVMGATVGFFGGWLRTPLLAIAPWVTLALGTIFLAVALRDFWPRRRRSAPTPSRLAQTAGALSRELAQHPHRRAFVLGMLLAFLPCTLAFWVLSLAAVSGSALHGALIMVTLVVITVPVLLAAAWTPLIIGRVRRVAAPWAARVPLALSAGWMFCIGLAGLEVIPHLHVQFGDHMVMLW